MDGWDALAFAGAAVVTFYAVVFIFQAVDERWRWRVAGRPWPSRFWAELEREARR